MPNLSVMKHALAQFTLSKSGFILQLEVDAISYVDRYKVFHLTRIRMHSGHPIEFAKYKSLQRLIKFTKSFC